MLLFDACIGILHNLYNHNNYHTDESRESKLSPVHTERVSARRRASTCFDASNQTNVKDSKHSHTRVDTRQVIFIHPMSGLLLPITINGQNIRVAIGLHHQTTTVLNDVTVNDVTDNDVIESLLNMHKLLVSRPNVISSTRCNALGVNGALGLRLCQYCHNLRAFCSRRLPRSSSVDFSLILSIRI